MSYAAVTVAGVGVASGDAIISASPTWETTGAAPQLTVVLSDRDRRLQDSALLLGAQSPTPLHLGDVITAQYAGTRWVATALDPGSTPTVTFEHWIAARLRGESGPFSSAAGQSGPQVARTLLTLSGRAPWRTVCPEASGRRPPVLDARSVLAERETVAERDVQRAPGFPDGAVLRIGWPAPGHPADREQRRILALAMSIADEERAGPKARLSLWCMLSVESAAKNLRGGEGTSSGVGQVTRETAQAIGIDPRNAERVIREYLRKGFGRYRPDGAIALERKHPSWSAGQIAQACQQSAYPGRYDSVAAQGRAGIKLWGGGSRGPERDSGRSSFQLDQGVTFWEYAGTLASSSGRARFVGQNAGEDALYWIAESELASSRPYVTVTPQDTGAILTPGQLDELRNVEKLSVQLAMPWDRCGEVVGRRISVAGYGVYSGEYVAEKVSAGSDPRWVSVELSKPRNPGKVAASTQGRTSPSRSGTSATAAGSVPERVQRVKTYIDGVTRKRGAYLWGGAGPDRFDCSGFASAVGKVAGIVSGRLTTATFESWGQSGEGEYLTFWVRETGVPERSHMYVTVKERGTLRVAEAGGVRGAPTGWRGPESPARRAGFKPRHAEGW